MTQVEVAISLSAFGFEPRAATAVVIEQTTAERVGRAFAGLGYYSRARNMHACAREIARRGGAFPRREAELRTLPGIGAYTAAAVAAIAFNEAAAPVDGNIARILARLLALEKSIARSRAELATAARALAPSRRAGDFAQALGLLFQTLMGLAVQFGRKLKLAGGVVSFPQGLVDPR